MKMLNVEFCIMKEDKDTGLMIKHRLGSLKMSDHLGPGADCNLTGKAFRLAPKGAELATIVDMTEF